MKNLATLFSLFLSVFLSLNLTACNWAKSVRGNGNVTKETRNVSSFNGVKASAGINVYLFQGESEKVVVETDENLQNCIVTRVEGNMLKCYIDCNVLRSSKLNVYVNFKTLNKIDASSGSDVSGETIIKSDHLQIETSSAADVKIEVEAGVVKCNSSSGSDAVIKGKADHFNADASRGSDIDARSLTVKTCEASASSGADIKITVTENIDASASSGGDVTYNGNPGVERVRESSGGNVKRR